MPRKQSDLFRHYAEISRSSHKFPGSFQNSRKVSTFENSREFCNPTPEVLKMVLLKKEKR